MQFLLKEITFKVLKSKSFFWPLILVFALLTVVLVYFVSIEDKYILPDMHNYSCNYYTDKANGGNSQVLDYLVSDSVIKIEFILSQGFSSPYVGFSISPVINKFIDAGRYNQIQLKVRGHGVKRLGVSLYTPPVDFSESSRKEEALFHTYLNISDKSETYNIAVNKLEAPDWWKDLHGIPTELKFDPDLSKVLHFNVGSTYTPDVNLKMSFEIYSIAFTRDNHQIFNALGFVGLSIVLLLFMIHYLGFRFNATNEQITILYKPLDVLNKADQLENYIEYISNNFQNSELSLEMVSKETSIPQRRIAKSIQTKFNCNFKTYVNRIRINESTRFLLQSNFNIGEIAYKVGFNNQSNFNRVFKNELGVSPSEYIEKHRT